MRTQLILTMSKELANRYAKNMRAFDATRLFADVRSVKLIGEAGYSMRVSVEEKDVRALRERLGDDFMIEDDYVLETFAAG